ncbi:MAG: hypothetical protein II022_00410, partial [Muribaculaceae bacterium]|nr:hypothetical protein [Muribaculaceae bacterium]
RLSNAGDVNKAILKGHASELIQVSEALQEKKIVQIAEEVTKRFLFFVALNAATPRLQSLFRKN